MVGENPRNLAIDRWRIMARCVALRLLATPTLGAFLRVIICPTDDIEQPAIDVFGERFHAALHVRDRHRGSTGVENAALTPARAAADARSDGLPPAENEHRYLRGVG